MFTGWTQLSDKERLILLSLSVAMVKSSETDGNWTRVGMVQEESGLESEGFERILRKLENKRLVKITDWLGSTNKKIEFQGKARSLILLVRTSTEIRTQEMPD